MRYQCISDTKLGTRMKQRLSAVGVEKLSSTEDKLDFRLRQETPGSATLHLSMGC